MKITTLAATLCITASIGIIWGVKPLSQSVPAFGTLQSGPQPRGYTSGKDCYIANGCYLPAKFSQCLDCCANHCPTPWNAGCVDECIARFDPKDVYAAAVDATRTISERKSEGQVDARTILLALQGVSDRRMAHAARLLAVEAQDYGGATGILQGTTR